MPRGLAVITAVNATLFVTFGGYLLYVFYAGDTVRTINFVCAWVAVTGLLASLFGIALRSGLWLRLTRGALYAMMLGFGLQLMGMVPELTDPASALTALALVALVAYLIGARGYLNAPAARAWFRVPEPPADRAGE